MTDPGSIIDNLSLTAVPEPSALGLLCLSAIALLRRRRS
ncbi:PEP-CTERM sorting domain-containing protein [Luteolibacter algae]|uniref:PEP-CTERM sorting domain-containing protein n=1 Tax=Luteolibacter algae TaxID=454151 RepID=A0ABW5D8R6_9BACT